MNWLSAWIFLAIVLLYACGATRDMDKINYARYCWELKHGFPWEVRAAELRGQTVEQYRAGYNWIIAVPDYEEWLEMNKIHVIVEPTEKDKLRQDLDRLRRELDAQRALLDTLDLMIDKIKIIKDDKKIKHEKSKPHPSDQWRPNWR